MSLDIWLTKNVPTTVYDCNITHNMTDMAAAAGIYRALWRPEEVNIFTAAELHDAIEQGWIDMINNPEKYEKYNPPNGWGDYYGFMSFLNKLIAACREHPDATVGAYR
jgi:hypothetical protein